MRITFLVKNYIMIVECLKIDTNLFGWLKSIKLKQYEEYTGVEKMTIEEKKSVLLVGATGLVGGELLTFLLNHSGHEKVKVFTRKALKINHPKLEQIIVDFNKLGQYKEHFNVKDVYCCLGTTIKKAGSQDAFRKVDYEYPVVLAKLAVERNVERFLIITAMGADKSSKVFYNRVKGEVEEELRKSGIGTLHIFRPSLLLGEREEFRLGEKVAIILSPILSLAMVGGLRKYRPIQAKNVAKAMLLTGQTEVSGTFVYPSDAIQEINDGHYNWK
jgi:uncharacterized protein YbjT (DUF2867 family)